jgi:hypothetical protein
VAAILQRTPWPTVQGGTTTIGDAPRVNIGMNRFPTWRPGSDASPYDAPAIHLPPAKIGEMRRKALLAAGLELTDVPEATTRLQALRSKSEAAAPPRLDGAPAHPLLRRSFAQLGATLLEGELELVAGAVTDVGRVMPNGAREQVALDFGCPVRASYRTDVDEPVLTAREVIAATKTLLTSLVPALEELPPFVRKRVRALALARVVETGRLEDADRDLPIFEATNGRFYRLAFLQGFAAYTTDPPPYPPVEDIVLCLDRGEAAALSKVLELRDDTNVLRGIKRGLEARAAPPLKEIKVKDRAQCMFFIDVNEEGVHGEIGLLHPSHAAARRIELFTTMRPLTYLPDPEGWPILPALNDDSVVANDSFSNLVDPKKDTTRLHQLLRRIVGTSISRLLEAPRDVLGVVRLPVPLLLRSVRSKRVAAAMGVFWLPAEWPERPSIHVEGIGVVDPDRLPLVEPGPRSRVVPVCGRLWVTAEAGDLAKAIADVMSFVAIRLVPHVRARGTERYQWDLALLGIAAAADADPVAELATDRPNAELFHVASRRAPHLIDKTTGDAPTPPTYVQHASAVVASEAPVETPAPPAESFFAGLVRRVTELVAGPPEILEESPLTGAIARALEGMQLTGQPVLAVRARKKGRPVVYDREKRQIVVNARHPVVMKHAERATGVLFLVLAALSEINRELVEVTDAEEVAKVLDLLRANAQG